jgi:4-hydroxyphenylacetate 3-monooxygenase
MLRTGAEHLESLRDGRTIYIGKEKITDVTTHPAFRNTAQTVAMLYDIKADPANHHITAFEEDGELYSTYYLKPKTRDDLARRSKMHKFWGDASYGLFGRSADHVAGWVTALAMQPEVMPKPEFSRNITAYYDYMRKNDIFLVYAVLPPQAARDPDFYARENVAFPTLRVTGEDDNGVTLNGMKMLATSAAFANEIWIGNVLPLAPTQVKESITCAIKVATPGVTLWSRKSFEREAQSTFDNPLSSRFDETDSMVLFDNVKVPWERVFVHDDTSASREIYHKSAAHRFGNHQSNVRFLSKLQLLLGIASKVTISNNAREIPAVKEVLGRLAAMEGALAGMIAGQCMDFDPLDHGYVSFNRRYMYAGLQWCTDSYNEITAIVRELCGGGVFQMPADISVLEDDALAKTFEQYWRAPKQTAIERMKLFKLAWDLLGSEFGGRHLQYEKFYAGPPFLVRNYNYQWAPWDKYDAIVDDLMAQYDVPSRETAALT